MSEKCLPFPDSCIAAIASYSMTSSARASSVAGISIIKGLKSAPQSLVALEPLLWNALQERNRLLHSFYRQHNFRLNSEEGRALMLNDLESMHDTLRRAHKAVMLLSGVYVDDPEDIAPTQHVQI